MILQPISTCEVATKIYDDGEAEFSPMWDVAKPLEDSVVLFAQLEISTSYQHDKKEEIYRIYKQGMVQDVVALSVDEALEKCQGMADKIEYISNKSEPIVLADGLRACEN